MRREINGFEIRAPREEDFEQIVAISDLGFGEETPREDFGRVSRESFPWQRALCAYDGDRVVGSLGAYSLELTLPGGATLPAGGITWGGTLPTHRRRGVLSALLAALLEDGAGRGEPLSVLMASEARIYPRFGYGPATSMLSFSIERSHAGFAPPADPGPRGRLALLSDEEAAVRLPALYDKVRLEQPGAVSRSSEWWSHYLWDPPRYRGGASKLYHVLHEDEAGTPDGYLSYRIKEDWAAATPMYEARVSESIFTGPRAYRDLWRYILDTDLVTTISCHCGRPDEPLRRLLVDSRRLEAKALVDDLYLRLLDVPRALAGRSYSAPGKVVLEVSEKFPVAKTGRYLLSTAGGGAPATCHPTDRPADLVLETGALATAYLDAETFTNLARAGRVRATADPTRLAEADAMFSWSMAPYCGTMF